VGKKKMLKIGYNVVEECYLFMLLKECKRGKNAVNKILSTIDGGWRGGKDADGNCASEESQHPSSGPGCFVTSGTVLLRRASILPQAQDALLLQVNCATKESQHPSSSSECVLQVYSATKMSQHPSSGPECFATSGKLCY
jgi:hypothetical protein